MTNIRKEVLVILWHLCFASYIAKNILGDEVIFEMNTFLLGRAATETT